MRLMHPRPPGPSGTSRTRVATVGVVGASGYSGLEALRILAGHPGVQLGFAASDRWEGELICERLGLAAPPPWLRGLTFCPQAAVLERARECEAVLLCTPAEVSLALAPRLLDAGVHVIDLSGAFRLEDPAAYPSAYRFEHPRPDLLASAVYGLTEHAREQVRGARLVANPGCYPTATLLALLPLVRRGLLGPWLVVDAASGVSGAGRKATEEMSFAELDGDYRAYRVLRHQHAPEIAQRLAAAARQASATGATDPSARPQLSFTTHLLPLKRGILVTAHARLVPGADEAALRRAYVDDHGNEPFVALRASADDVSLRQVVGTNRCAIGLSADVAAGEVVVTSAIDNLTKGAAGQAVQNLNLVLGFDEAAGLQTLQGLWP